MPTSPSDAHETNGADQAPAQSYYDLLEVAPSATRSEIADAYQRAQAAFAPDSLATYMLFTPEEAQVVSARLEDAFRVLSDANERARYDRRLGWSTPVAGRPVSADVESALDTETGVGGGEAAGVTDEDGDPPTTRATQRVDDILAAAPHCDGPTLQRLREARDLTLGDINLTTKISLSNLRLIEADDLDALPAPVYLRGYLRQIAEHLRIDSDWVISGYMTRIASASTHIR
jgi:DnaJ-class molecular chaperone